MRQIKSRFRRPCAAMAVMALLQGCMSVDQMQRLPPAQNFISAQRPMETADCIYSRDVGIDRGATIRRSTVNGVFRITADSGNTQVGAMYDIAIFDADGHTRVELRAHSNVWGGPEEPDDVPKIIADCSLQP